MKQFGFTFIELLVSIAIIMLMSGILLPNYHLITEQLFILQAAYEFAQNLRVAQEMSASAREFPDGVVPSGYGIYLKNNDQSYILYADINGDQAYYEGGDDRIIKTIDMGGIRIQDASPSPVSINFEGPEPTTKITNDVNSIEIDIVLLDNPTKKQTIVVYKSGLIYVE